MKKRSILVFFCLLGGIVVSCTKLSKELPAPPLKKTQHAKCKHNSYFLPITITGFTSENIPSLLIQIGDEAFPAKLDLGYRGDLALPPENLNRIKEKTYIRSKKMYGFRGGEYEEKVYEIPRVVIGSISFLQSQIDEEAEALQKELILSKDGYQPLFQPLGRVGWKLFRNTNLFLDLGNAKIAFCDSLASLKKEGCPVEMFIETPLLTDRGFVEFEAKTLNGPLRCMLDTGATWNILNTELKGGESVEQIAWEPDRISEIPQFKIGEKDFGPLVFHQIPIKLPMQIDAIVGMEFFQKNVVFLDFAEDQVYIAPLTQQKKPLDGR